MKKRIMIIIAILAGIFYSANIHAQNTDKISVLGVVIHGYISQGYLKSTDNNYLAKNSKDGTFAYNDIAINFNKRLTDQLRLGLQLFSHDLGDIGNNEVILDWAYADYRWRDWAGLRVGKIKFPFGLYGENRDVDVLRTSVLLPQSVYKDLQRDTLFAIQGIGVYGYVPVDIMGALSYQFQLGTFDIDTNSGTAKFIELVSLGAFKADNFDVDDAYAGGIQWHTPFEGLRISATFLNYSFESNMTTTGVGGIPPNIPVLVDAPDVTNYVLSIEYSWKDLVVAAEYAKQEAELEIVGLEPKSTREEEGYYFSASYRFTGWLELGTYYSVFYPNADDKDGDELENMGLPDHGAWLKDFALTTRFDINEYWIFKLEGHLMDGTAMLVASDNPPFPTEDDWFLFAAKITFSF